MLVIFLSCAVAGCAKRPPASDPIARAAYDEANDPLEPLNRSTLKVNNAIEKVLLRPLNAVYIRVFPGKLRSAFGHFLNNLREPVTFLNDILQGKPKRAGKTLARFLVNSVLGIGGLVDQARHINIPYHKEDFGQTLAVWGVGEGAYLVMPFFGPSSVRDGIGTGVDTVSSPFFWLLNNSDFGFLRFARQGFDGLHQYSINRDNLKRLRSGSLDYYTALRSAYRQARANAIRDGAPPSADLPEYLDDDLLDEDIEAFEDPEVEETDTGGDTGSPPAPLYIDEMTPNGAVDP
ncbi:MAG: VacJ family lipoprotein [Pseudomonadota bacterium]